MLSKFLEPRIWGRIWRERAGEPILYNLASIGVAAFGSITRKIDYDLVPRQPYAFGLQQAFAFAARERERLGIKRLIFIEFGVASGAGLMNLCRVGTALSRHHNMPFQCIGFDAGAGMPEPIDYRDHPEKYLDGDFKPHDQAALDRALPGYASVIYGPIGERLGELRDKLEPGDFIGFVSIDVDYWSSTTDALKLFDSQDVCFLPRLPVYLDDVNNIDHHPFAGELLAVDEFNRNRQHRKVVKMNGLRNWRLFKNALWLEQMYWMLDLKNRYFSRDYHADRPRIRLGNPYLGMPLEEAA